MGEGGCIGEGGCMGGDGGARGLTIWLNSSSDFLIASAEKVAKVARPPNTPTPTPTSKSFPMLVIVNQA